MISRYDWREAIIGKVMTYQHRLLSEYYDVSLPVIDELVNFLVSEGAYGPSYPGGLVWVVQSLRLLGTRLSPGKY